ncbi:MAG: T9SS type A sorting domain-containing protein [bacterium]|nr:T9SS type A sorting domain-containing protein [bacterium]
MEVDGIYLQPNDKLYYIWKTYTPGYPGASILYERIDSSTSKIYKYDESLGLPDDEYLIDDLLAEPGDTVLSFRFYLPGSSFTLVIRDTLFEKWGLTKTKRLFQEIGSGIPKPTYSLTEDIGLDSMFFDWDYNNYDTYVLKGCIIDGVVYGDTTAVGVDDEEYPIASEFKLEQNYPNPFNPSTKIKFTIPLVETTRRVVFTTLKVYDILGNEIATLVNEELAAGEYEVEFDALSGIGNLPAGRQGLISGIYFYQLNAGDFIQTKKMILLK